MTEMERNFKRDCKMAMLKQIAFYGAVVLLAVLAYVFVNGGVKW
jgi:hypothetical protein